jgi:hypothetical protein
MASILTGKSFCLSIGLDGNALPACLRLPNVMQ